MTLTAKKNIIKVNPVETFLRFAESSLASQQVTFLGIRLYVDLLNGMKAKEFRKHATASINATRSYLSYCLY